MAKSPRPHARAVRNSNSSQASVALRAMPQVKRCGYYLEKSAATAALPAAKPASFESPKLSRSPYTVRSWAPSTTTSTDSVTIPWDNGEQRKRGNKKKTHLKNHTPEYALSLCLPVSLSLLSPLFLSSPAVLPSLSIHFGPSLLWNTG